MKSVKLNVRIDEATREEFKRIAEKNIQNPSALVRKWIENYIEENRRMPDGRN